MPDKSGIRQLGYQKLPDELQLISYSFLAVVSTDVIADALALAPPKELLRKELRGFARQPDVW